VDDRLVWEDEYQIPPIVGLRKTARETQTTGFVDLSSSRELRQPHQAAHKLFNQAEWHPDFPLLQTKLKKERLA
jgi:hypothetical protein